MQRSRSGSRLIETAFVSRLPSSLEDLDEVDRLANHPVLRPSPTNSSASLLLSQQPTGRLRKSRSEMGGYGGRGLALWSGQGETASTTASTSSTTATKQLNRLGSKSGQNSPVTPSHFGCRTVGVAMMIKSGRRYKNSKNSNAGANQTSRSSGELHYYPPRSPASACSPLTSDRASSSAAMTPPVRKSLSARQQHRVVTAVIETDMRRSCITPPADLRASSHFRPDDRLITTPPNTAPLPSKFARTPTDHAGSGSGISPHKEISRMMTSPPQNLLPWQLKMRPSTNVDTDNSSNMTASPIGRRMSDHDEMSPPLPKYRMPPPRSIISRLQQLDSARFGGSGSCSSSADSTPQKRQRPVPPPKLSLPISSPQQQPQQQPQLKFLNLNAKHNSNSSIGSTSSSLAAANKREPPTLGDQTSSKSSAMLALRGGRARLFACESESCSSAVSSLDSICSGSSESGHASSSEVSMSMPTSRNATAVTPSMTGPSVLRPPGRSNLPPKSLMAKFQILSPISDKSQEQNSEQGDSSSTKTPKISPTDHILACCGAANMTEDDKFSNEVTYSKPFNLGYNSASNNHNNNNAVTCSSNNNNNDGGHFNLSNMQSSNNNINNNGNLSSSQSDLDTTPAPFSMPKLHRRLREQQQQQHQQQLVLQQRDRRRETEVHGSDSGISMASQDVVDIYELLQLPFDMPKLRRRTQYIAASERPQSVPNRNQNFLDAAQTGSPRLSLKPTGNDQQQQQRFSLNLNNVKPSSITMTTCSITSAAFALPSSHRERGIFAPPPPGFVDDTDQYYMPGSEEDVAKTSDVEDSQKSMEPIVQRRNRPKMSLTFNVDPKEKSMMFVTNSPFDLIDCIDVNPNLPLERQDWYHGSISRSEAESILKPEREGSYLVRNVDQHRQEFALSLKSARGYMHMRVRRDASSREFQLSDFPRRFLTIPEMVHHYTRNRLPIKGAEHMCLKQPVAITLL